MKRLTTLAVSGVLALCLSACGESPKEIKQTAEDAKTVAAEAKDKAAEAEDKAAEAEDKAAEAHHKANAAEDALQDAAPSEPAETAPQDGSSDAAAPGNM